MLATSGKETTTLWDGASYQALRSGPGTHVTLSNEGKWLVARKEGKSISVQELESGRTLASFPDLGPPEKYTISRDGLSLARYSVLGGSMLTAAGPGRIDLGLPNLGEPVCIISWAGAWLNWSVPTAFKKLISSAMVER